jgi:DNA-binding CsgD family transcriptional regulator
MAVGQARALLVGRGFEMEKVGAALAAVATERAGSIVLLAGEAGVGKSHLLEATAEQARALEMEVLVGRCFVEAGQRGFGPWRQALGDAPFEEAPASGAARGGQVGRDGRFEAVLRHLETRARARPLLLSLEDLHWGDPDSLFLFLHLARFGTRSPILLAGSVRTADPDAARNPALDEVLGELAREGRYQCLSLRAFSEPEVAAFAEGLVGVAVPQAVVRLLHGETGGNPLYLRETLRHLLEEGKLERREGRIVTEFALAELGLPRTVRHLVRQRAARLSDPALALLRCASAVGDGADLATLAAAAGQDREALLDPLDEVIASGLLLPRAGGYEVSHAIVRRAILEELNPERRTRLARQLAEALAGRPSPEPAAVAAQYHASRDLPGAERGLPFALAAARAARASGAFERAGALLNMALDLAAPLGDEAVADAAARLAIARAETIDHAGAVAAAQQAAAAFTRLGDPSRMAPLLEAVARELDSGGAPRALWEPLLAAGLAALGDRRDAVWWRLTLLARRPIPVLEGPIWVSRSPGADPALFVPLRASGDELDFAVTVCREDARTPRESDELLERIAGWKDPAAIIRVLDACTRDSFFRGTDFRRTIALAESLAVHADRSGSPVGRVGALVLLGCACAATGNPGRAREALQQVEQLATRLGALHRLGGIGWVSLASVLGYLTGGVDWGAIGAQLHDAVSSPAGVDFKFGIAGLNLGLVAASLTGDRDSAERLLPLHRRTLAELPRELTEWGAYRDCGATAVWHLGSAEHARVYLETALRDLADGRPGCVCWSTTELTAARMAALLGHLDQAVLQFQAARGALERSGRQPLTAICDHDEALALIRNRRAGDGRVGELLDRAARSFAALGMSPWSARVEQLRGQVAPAETPLPDGLSPRELEVLRLLAQGQANKEIARALGISVQTVERHVANIYAKIGTHGRAAATGYAMRRGLLPG